MTTHTTVTNVPNPEDETAASAVMGSDESSIQAGSRYDGTNEPSSPAGSFDTSNSETAESAATGSDNLIQAGSRDDTNEPSSPAGSFDTSNSETAESAATGSDESEPPEWNFGSSEGPSAPKRPRLVLSEYEQATKSYEKTFEMLMHGQRNKEMWVIVKGNHAHFQLMVHAHKEEIEAKEKEHAEVIKSMDDKYKDECSKAKDAHVKEIDAKDKEIAELRNEFAEYKTKYKAWAEDQKKISEEQSEIGFKALVACQEWMELEKLRRQFGSIDGSVNH
jgi:hypothetical protein